MGMIPKRIHFVWINSKACGTPEFGFPQWVAVRSAVKANPDHKVYVWTNHDPAGKYWQAIQPLIECMPIWPPDSAHGNEIPHPAHKTDLTRIKLLYHWGGVYLDMDTITVKSFDSILDRNSPIMVREVVGGQFVGLCNAFIASPPFAPFLSQWDDKFAEFSSKGRDDKWNESGVQWPAQIQAENPSLCDTLPETAFFVPDWSPDGVAAMFDRCEEYPDAYGHHLWSAITHERLKEFDETNYESKPCTYTNLIRKHLHDEIRSELV